MKRNWQILKPDLKVVDNIRKTINCSFFLASILANRKIVSPKDLSDFLDISLDNLRNPFSIKDMETAVKRIYNAFINHEKILVFGDYDVDGVTSTAVMMEFFKHTGADVSYYIPHRTKEGYSIQKNHISDVAVPGKINLIITVDCGSSSHEAIKTARDAGIDIIITDHHIIPEILPEATALVSPKRADCSSGLENLAGVGVAFYLIMSLRKYLRDMNFWYSRPEPNLKNLCDLIALGTVADMVPLLGENRIFAKTGLDLINSGNRIGISALIKAGGSNKYPIDSEDIAFRLAPRINALGRVDHARDAVELLLTEESETANRIAQRMNLMNTNRQTIEKKIYDHIMEHLDSNPDLLQNRSIVLSHGGWNEGILGIVASRMVEKFNRPVVLFAEKDDFAKGSARSVPGFNLYEGVMACSGLLDSFGGHSMAAGIRIKIQNIVKFREEFEKTVRAEMKDLPPLTDIDCEIQFNDIDDALTDEIESLKPFGAGNPEPLFLSRNVKVLSSEFVGGNHRKMALSQTSRNGERILNGIQFNTDPYSSEKNFFESMIFKLRWNRWNGNKSLQIIIEDV
jgi:single-stranded-DNA-specific exonuclease